MSHWGSFLLTNCQNDLTIDLKQFWFFPSELRELTNLARNLGVTIL